MLAGSSQAMASASTASTPLRKGGMTRSLWLVQVVLAAVYGLAGLMKSTQPIEALSAMMGWPGNVPEWLVRFIGVAELAGAIGLILPSALRIAPRLTPLAAMGLTLIQGLAIPYHWSRGEMFMLPANLTLLAMSAFVAWGRLRKAPIEPR
jgi:uncharacterized membrane protein YphA (DoxX/SURF4 family)